MTRLFSMRLSESEYGELRRRAGLAGVSMTRLVKDALGLAADERADERFEDLERRVSRLEGVAGL